ncbi:MAG: HRDC domain-containing protein [Candidatus Nanoarchaeia archaeon]
MTPVSSVQQTYTVIKENETIYVDTQQKLAEQAKIWNECEELGIDIECENNLHHYGAYISLIQISSKNKNWVIDVLNLKEVPHLTQVLENRNVLKIFHDVSFDFRILDHEFSCRPRNVFDTQMAALLLGKKTLGLGALLQQYFNAKKEEKFQMADWTKRPLTPDMISYASKDTSYLIKLKELLLKELSDKGRTEWIQEECALLEKTDFKYKEGDFFDIKGVSKISNKERAILKKLVDLREFLAEKVNRPTHFILSTKRLLDLAKSPPTLSEWSNMVGVHPIVRVKARLLFEEVNKAAKTELAMPKKGPKLSYSQKQKDEFEKYNLIRDSLAEKYKVEKHVILSKDQIKEIVITGKFEALSTWQKRLVQDELRKHH